MALGTAYVAAGLVAVLVGGIFVGQHLAPQEKEALLWGHTLDAQASAHDHAAMPADGSEHTAHGEHAGHTHTTGILSPTDFDPQAAPDLRHDPPFPLEKGVLPTLAEAKEFSRKYSRFIAKGDEGLDKLRAEGHLMGEGTPERPYVLEKFYVDGELSITSTDKPLIIRSGYVAGQLKLNYIGEQVYVHHVYADDLRVNENVKRYGPNTGGYFHDNHFAFVGQIRHFVGEFTQNKVGPKPAGAVADFLADTGAQKVAPEVVFNFDGFHMANVHHNEFVGMVDIKIHGHNHGDCFTCPVHDHADKAEYPQAHNETEEASDTMRTRHSYRYASLAFTDNTISVPGGIALRYNDRNHAGDDRTANSEPNEYLEDAHLHYQDVTIKANQLKGGSLVVDVFNAQDERHTVQNRGILRLWANDVTVQYPSATLGGSRAPVSGIVLSAADGLELSARDNVVRFGEAKSDQPGQELSRAVQKPPELRGFELRQVDASNLTLRSNTVEAGRYGVWAQSFSASVDWWLLSNTFRTQDAWRGSDIENPPKEDPQ